MGDENPIRTLKDYSRPSHTGYQNTIELPVGNNVVPLRSDTIRLVQNKCSIHGLRSEDPNQHFKDFLKLMDSLNLDDVNRQRMRLRLFQFSFYDQASNWLERLLAGPISTWEDLTTCFLAQFFSPERTAKLRNNIMLFQQHQGESLSEAWTHFKDFLQKVSHHGIDLWLQVQIFYDRVNPAIRQTIDHSAGDGTKSYPIGIVKNVEVHIGRLKLFDDFYIIDMDKDPATPLLVGRGFLATGNVVIDCRKAKIAVEEGVTSMDGIGARPPYYANKNFADHHLPGEWEIARDVELNPFKDILVFRRMAEFLGVIPINLKGNM
nr:zinc finger, CCHC-type [Tanacetum cinerariifolium]